MRDHQVNLNAELEIRRLHQKVDARSAIRLFGRPLSTLSTDRPSFFP